jgi:alginate O-acetyltransferase complex protein AlgI
VWGAIHGVFLAIEHYRHDRRVALGRPDPPDTLFHRVRGRIITFHIVCFAWVFFRAESFEAAGDVLGRLFDFDHWLDASPLITTGVLLAIAAGLLEQYIPHGAMSRAMSGFARLAPVAQGLILAVALMATNTMGPRGVAPFIYFRF